MIRLLLTAAFLACATPAAAQQVPVDKALAIIADGKVISSADVTTSTATRTHQAFIFFEGALYLCNLLGNAQSGTAPWAACFGPK